MRRTQVSDEHKNAPFYLTSRRNASSIDVSRHEPLSASSYGEFADTAILSICHGSLDVHISSHSSSFPLIKTRTPVVKGYVPMYRRQLQASLAHSRRDLVVSSCRLQPLYTPYTVPCTEIPSRMGCISLVNHGNQASNSATFLNVVGRPVILSTL